MRVQHFLLFTIIILILLRICGELIIKKVTQVEDEFIKV